MTPGEHRANWQGKVNAAAAAFESRWTQLALRNLDPELAIALHEQRQLFNEACITGGPSEIAMQGAAMLRGYAQVQARMIDAQIPDDSYVLGTCPTTGYRVAIGINKASLKRVVELHGQDVVWFSPDEVATLAASSEAFMTVGAIKKKFPGAEVIERYASEGS
jgi:hypothetical protein